MSSNSRFAPVLLAALAVTYTSANRVAAADASLLPQARQLVGVAQSYEKSGQHNEAVIAFTQAVEMHVLPIVEQSRTLFARGVVLEELGQTHDAAEDYAGSLRLTPNFSPAKEKLKLLRLSAAAEEGDQQSTSAAQQGTTQGQSAEPPSPQEAPIFLKPPTPHKRDNQSP